MFPFIGVMVYYSTTSKIMKGKLRSIHMSPNIYFELLNRQLIKNDWLFRIECMYFLIKLFCVVKLDSKYATFDK